VGKEFVDTFPFPITREVLERGRERFNIFCSPCHDRTGYGHGTVVGRGYAVPPSYHIERLRRAAPGYFFDVITNGFGAMPDHRDQVPVRDRWAIAAYLRALQTSQNARPEDVPAGALLRLEAESP
jgi:mono/diheme cytochrome c family protein